MVPLPEINPSSQIFAGRELTNPRVGVGSDREFTEGVAALGIFIDEGFIFSV
jgi:hypothetical protein